MRQLGFGAPEKDGVWRVDVMETLQRTLSIIKGKNEFGIYDGTPKCWVPDTVDDARDSK